MILIADHDLDGHAVSPDRTVVVSHGEYRRVRARNCICICWVLVGNTLPVAKLPFVGDDRSIAVSSGSCKRCRKRCVTTQWSCGCSRFGKPVVVSDYAGHRVRIIVLLEIAVLDACITVLTPSGTPAVLDDPAIIRIIPSNQNHCMVRPADTILARLRW